MKTFFSFLLANSEGKEGIVTYHFNWNHFFLDAVFMTSGDGRNSYSTVVQCVGM